MSIVTDIIKIADQIRQFLGRKDKSDSALFESLTEPMYKQLEVVTRELLEMYRPILLALEDLNARREAVHYRSEKALSDKTTRSRKTDRHIERAKSAVDRRFLDSNSMVLRGLCEQFKQNKQQPVR